MTTMLITVIMIVLIDMALLISISIIHKDLMVKTKINKYKIQIMDKIKVCVKILMDHQETQNIS